MKIFGLEFKVLKAPSRKVRLSVLELSFKELRDDMILMAEKLELTARQVEATRKKVYRDGDRQEEAMSHVPGSSPSLAELVARLGPGDPPPSGMQ